MPTDVTLEIKKSVALITLDGEDRLNAFSGNTARALSDAYRRCDLDDGIRAVVVTGAGRAFCSGADMSEDARAFAPAGHLFTASPIRPPAWEVRKLVIAAINGHAIGIGLTIALQCDLRFVASDAKLAIPQVRRGMLGDAQSHYTLRSIAGAAVAADLLLTGRTIDGTEAHELGIVNQVFPSEEVLPAALELARDVAVNASPASVALSKQLLWADRGRSEVAVKETAAHHILMAHEDAFEGPAAWREKREPQWKLRVSSLPSG
ncbi:MAG: crotonase [Marmoricola sp.]|nr:crotonase [Marmoricola sp.]